MTLSVVISGFRQVYCWAPNSRTRVKHPPRPRRPASNRSIMVRVRVSQSPPARARQRRARVRVDMPEYNRHERHGFAYYALHIAAAATLSFHFPTLHPSNTGLRPSRYRGPGPCPHPGDAFTHGASPGTGPPPGARLMAPLRRRPPLQLHDLSANVQSQELTRSARRSLRHVGDNTARRLASDRTTLPPPDYLRGSGTGLPRAAYLHLHLRPSAPRPPPAISNCGSQSPSYGAHALRLTATWTIR
jgi:hypothetical protein